jgi:hypothetical protein
MVASEYRLKRPYRMCVFWGFLSNAECLLRADTVEKLGTLTLVMR